MSSWPLRPKLGETRPPSRDRVVPRHAVLVACALGAVRSSAAVISVEEPVTAPRPRARAALLVEDHAGLPPSPPQPPALAAVARSAARAARAFVAVAHAEVTAICTQAAIHAQQQQRHADAPAGGGGATAPPLPTVTRGAAVARRGRDEKRETRARTRGRRKGLLLEGATLRSACEGGGGRANATERSVSAACELWLRLPGVNSKTKPHRLRTTTTAPTDGARHYAHEAQTAAGPPRRRHRRLRRGRWRRTRRARAAAAAVSRRHRNDESCRS